MDNIMVKGNSSGIMKNFFLVMGLVLAVACTTPRSEVMVRTADGGAVRLHLLLQIRLSIDLRWHQTAAEPIPPVAPRTMVVPVLFILKQK